METLFLILSVVAGGVVAHGLLQKRQGKPADAKITVAAVIAIACVTGYTFTGGPVSPKSVRSSPVVAAEKAGAAIAAAMAGARVLVIAFLPVGGKGAEGDPAITALKKGLGGKASIAGTVVLELPGAEQNLSADQMAAARMMAVQTFSAASFDRLVEPYLDKADVVVLLVPPPGDLRQSALVGRRDGPLLAVAVPAGFLPPLELFQSGTVAAAVLARQNKKEGNCIVVTPANAAAIAAETPEAFQQN